MVAGDEEAFASIYKHYIFPVSQFLLRYVKSPQIAEDLSQDIFSKVWEGRERIPQIGSFKGYLFIMARNHSLNVLKNAAQAPSLMGEIVRHYKQQPFRTDTEDEVLHRQYLEFLHNIIEKLPPRSREVFRLCRQQERSYDEVANLLGISRNSVKNHMVHSMKVLKASVEKELGISFSLFLLIIGRY